MFFWEGGECVSRAKSKTLMCVHGFGLVSQMLHGFWERLHFTQDSILIEFIFCKHLCFESCVLCGSFSEAETGFINIIFGNSAVMEMWTLSVSAAFKERAANRIGWIWLHSSNLGFKG